MIRDKLKGRVEFNMVVIFVASLVVFVVALGLFLGIWDITIPTVQGQGDIQSECAKWQAGDPPCSESWSATENGELKYPILNQTYGTDVESAKEFCNCPD